MKAFILTLVLLSFAQLPVPALTELDLFPHDSFGEALCHSIDYAKENHSFHLELPGKLEDSITKVHLCFFHSIDRDVHYGFYFNPSKSFESPQTLEAFMKIYQHLNNVEIIALHTNSRTVRYAIQINFQREDGSLRGITQVYATQRSIYYATVEGFDLTRAESFFQSIRIRR